MRMEQSELDLVKGFLEKTFICGGSEDSGEEKIKKASIYILYTHEDGSQSKEVITNIEIA